MAKLRAQRRRSPVTKNWTYRWRVINGVRRLVKVRRIGGRDQIRMADVVSTTDTGPVRHRRRRG